MKFYLKYNTLRDILLLILYKITLDIIYAKGVSVIYNFSGFNYHFSITKYILLTIFFILMIKWITDLFYNPRMSDIVVLTISLLYFIPGITYLSFEKLENSYIIYYITYWFLMLFTNRYIFNKQYQIKQINKVQNYIIFNSLFILFIFIVLYTSWKYTGFRIHFNLQDVYELRKEERAMQMSTVLRYLIPAISLIIPSMMIFFLVKKKRSIVLVLLLCELLLFGIGGHKSYLFLIFLSFAIYFLYSKKRLVYIPLALVLFNTIPFIEFLFLKKSYILSFFQHRILFLPNQIGAHIYDFMKSNELLRLRESIMRFIGLESPYDKSLFFIIGDQYYNDEFTRANTGLCGDAFSQFGFWSLLIYPLLIPLLFKIIDIVSVNVNRKITFFVAFIYANTFINGSFFSVLLTNGLILFIFILYLLSGIEKN